MTPWDTLRSLPWGRVGRVGVWVGIVAALLAAAIIGTRAEEERRVAQRQASWPTADAEVEAVRGRPTGGVELRVAFVTSGGKRVRAVLSDAPRGPGGWVSARQRVAYSPSDPENVVAAEISVPPWWTVPLRGGVPLGMAGALWSLGPALGGWRQRRRLVRAAAWFVGGLAAWLAAVGGRSGAPAAARVLNRALGSIVGVVSGVVVPLTAFAVGAGLAWWATRHRPEVVARVARLLRRHVGDVKDLGPREGGRDRPTGRS